MSPKLPDVEPSVIPWFMFAISNVLTYLQFVWECATPPHVHPMSRYVIAHDQFYQAFPHINTASEKPWGEKV